MASRQFDVLSMGRLAVDLYADEIGVPLGQVQHFSVYAGGCPTNVVVGTRRLGLRTAMLSRVGYDGLADGLLDFLRAEGINVDHIARDPHHLTGLAFLAIVPPDTFPLTYFRENAADLYITLDDVLNAPIAQSRLLFTAGTNLSAEPSRGATLAAMERARTVGTRVFFDIDLRKSLWPDLRAFGVAMRSALPLAHVVIGTEDEVLAAGTLAGDTPDLKEAVNHILRHGVEAVALKRGGRGAEVHTANGSIHRAEPFRVEVLNTLGAGDAWASGFIYGYLHGWDWRECVRFGNATGAIIVTRHACANDMPTYDETMAFIAKQEHDATT